MLEYREMPMAEDRIARWNWIDFDLDGVRSSLLAASKRVAALITTAGDPHQRADKLEWSVAETAAHLVVVGRTYLQHAEGRTESRFDLDHPAESNRSLIDEIGERRLDVLAHDMDAAVAALVTASQGRPAMEVVPWHSATTIPLGAFLGMCLGELLVQGRDIARTVGRPWPLGAEDAVHVLRSLFVVGPLVVDRERAAARPITYRIRSKGLPHTTWRFADGALDVTPDPPARVNCHMAVDPVAWILVAYGRRSALGAALRGRAFSWGRKPWAGFRFRSYFPGT